MSIEAAKDNGEPVTVFAAVPAINLLVPACATVLVNPLAVKSLNMFAATAPSVAAPIALRYPAPPTKAPATVPIPVGKS